MKLHLPVGPEHAPEHGLFNAYERKRFVMLSVLLVMVLGMFVYGYVKSRAEQPDQVAGEAPERPRVELVLPEIDREALRARTADSTPEQRVILETAALEQLLRASRMIGPDHFEPMGGALLTPEVAAGLEADPAAHRGDLLRAYGTIEAIEAFDAGGDTTAHYRGRLRLEGGGTAWFAALILPDDWGEVGQFVRLDGLFLEIYRDQAGGRWIDAPLIVGQRIVRAYPQLGPVTALDPMLFSGVEDDSAEGITGQPFDAYWTLLAHARDLPEDAIDWDSVPLLDGEQLARLFEDGDDYRARPFRIEPSEILDIWHVAQPENPARIGRLVQGWIANWDWYKQRVPLVQFAAPVDTTGLKRGDYMTARGFFLKNLSYEPRDGGVAVAPFFVLHSFESFTPPESAGMTTIFGAIAVGLLVMAVLVYVALMRDRRKASQLQDELRRRRKARRAAQPQQS